MTDPQERPNEAVPTDDEMSRDVAFGAPTEPTVVELGASEPRSVGATAAEASDAATIDREKRVERPRAPRPTPAQHAASPYAIIETGGKQYRVSVGDSLAVEKLPVEAGGNLTIDRVLLIGGAGAPRVGTPTVPGAAVTARIEDHYRGDKIVVFKYKAKKRYRRRMGHRQSLTRLTITGITG